MENQNKNIESKRITTKCAHCGNEIPTESTFCKYCGTKQEKETLGISSTLFTSNRFWLIVFFFALILLGILMLMNNTGNIEKTKDGFYVLYREKVSSGRKPFTIYHSNTKCENINNSITYKLISPKEADIFIEELCPICISLEEAREITNKHK